MTSDILRYCWQYNSILVHFTIQVYHYMTSDILLTVYQYYSAFHYHRLHKKNFKKFYTIVHLTITTNVNDTVIVSEWNAKQVLTFLPAAHTDSGGSVQTNPVPCAWTPHISGMSGKRKALLDDIACSVSSVRVTILSGISVNQLNFSMALTQTKAKAMQ